MTEINKNKIYKGIDVFKLIAACLVLLLHTVETNSFFPKGVQFVFTRVAVPFFFIASGFFFYKGLEKAEEKKGYLIKYEQHLAIMYAVWGLVINLPFTLHSYLKLYEGQSWIKIFVVLFRRIFIIGSGPYWYIIALFWSALFIYWCYRTGKEKVLYAAIVLGLFLEIIYTCFQGVLSNILIFDLFFKGTYFIFSWQNNFFMYGIPFMGIGYLIAKHDFDIKMNTAVILLILFTAVRVIEYILPYISGSSFFEANAINIAFIPQSVCFFMVGKNLKSGISAARSKSVRQLSSCIYFSHWIFLYNILNPLLKKYTELPVYAGWMILPKDIIVLFACCTLFIVVKKINNKTLNILING